MSTSVQRHSCQASCIYVNEQTVVCGNTYYRFVSSQTRLVTFLTNSDPANAGSFAVMSFPPSVLTAEISLILQESSQLKKGTKKRGHVQLRFTFVTATGQHQQYVVLQMAILCQCLKCSVVVFCQGGQACCTYAKCCSRFIQINLINFYIFVAAFPLGRVLGAAALGGIAIPHGQQ